MLKFFSSKPAAPAPAGPKPRARRDAFECTATVRAGEVFHRVTLCDVSASGCKIAQAEPLRAGERVQIALEAYHSLSGTVRWSRGGLAGIQFTTPLGDAVLQGWKNAVTIGRAAPPPRAAKQWRNFLGEPVYGGPSE